MAGRHSVRRLETLGDEATGVVVAFRPRADRMRRDRPADGEPGRIVLFTGVRYERHGVAAGREAAEPSADLPFHRPALQPHG